ncbi:hypothetical protein V1514DRAFT_327670 [Lipomyces japonicus]|uniref:uncharacterized protein n=1 Tax=Lipomyces japonicus TaxID=56871 RepID=UPI0034CDE3E9
MIRTVTLRRACTLRRCFSNSSTIRYKDLFGEASGPEKPATASSPPPPPSETSSFPSRSSTATSTSSSWAHNLPNSSSTLNTTENIQNNGTLNFNEQEIHAEQKFAVELENDTKSAWDKTTYKAQDYFEHFSIRPVVLKALRKIFPDVVHPTKAQAALLAAVSDGKSFIGSALPGSGLSLAVVLYLLSLPNFRTPVQSSTSIIFVPTVELGYQYYNLITSLLRSGNAPVQVDNIVQLHYRSSIEDQNAQMDVLAKHPLPHIIIATPKRFMDIMSEPKNTFQLYFLRTVVLDEASYMLVPGKVLSKKDRLAAGLKIKAPNHPSPIAVALKYITDLHKRSQIAYSLRNRLQTITLSSAPSLSQLMYRSVQQLGLIRHGDGEYGIKENAMVHPRYRTYHLQVPNTETNCITFMPRTNQLIDTDLNVNPSPDTDRIDELLYQQSEYVTVGVSADDLTGLKKLIDEDKVKRAFVVVSSHASRFQVAQYLKSIGVKVAVLGLPELYVPNSKVTSWYDREYFNTRSTTTETSEDQVIICNARQLAGLDFPGLSRIYWLCDDPKQMQDYSTILSTLRVNDAHEVSLAQSPPNWLEDRKKGHHEIGKVVFLLSHFHRARTKSLQTTFDMVLDDQKTFFNKFAIKPSKMF